MGMWSSATKEYGSEPCTNCGEVKVEGQWWHLRNYFGIAGYFCPTCYIMVSHDSYKTPTDPKGYNSVRIRQEMEKHK